MKPRRVAIIGSGFAGTILARVLGRQRHEVTLLERGEHPRFALGESSTPLAAICLERLAARYDLGDLHDLAAYGRWIERLPGVRRGLKRGFTFYAHRAGEPYDNDAGNARRLLVAASPRDEVADAHWLREDVDHHLVRRALEEGVDYRDGTEVVRLTRRGKGWRLTLRRAGRGSALDARLVVDASGAGGFLARELGIPSRAGGAGLDTGLVHGHFESVRPFAEVVGCELPSGPYPEERAAVHHLLEEGWMYVLPFDHGVVSAGIVVERARGWKHAAGAPPEEAWRGLLGRYPSLEAQFAPARPVRPIAVVPRLQRRLARAAGDGWALLPHAFAFSSPMFSTGIAWSLLGVERLALALESGTEEGLSASLSRYGSLLAAEADHVERLIAGAYAVRGDFGLFAAHSHLYFAAASYAEAAQRLLPAPGDGDAWGWDGFLGATDGAMRKAVAEAERERARLRETPDAETRYFEAVRRLIEPRNLAGLADARRRRMYPVDLDALVAAHDLLGLSEAAVRAALPRLRGGT